MKFSRLLEKHQNLDLNADVLDLKAGVVQRVWHIPNQMNKNKFRHWHIKVKLKITEEKQKILKKTSEKKKTNYLTPWRYTSAVFLLPLSLQTTWKKWKSIPNLIASKASFKKKHKITITKKITKEKLKDLNTWILMYWINWIVPNKWMESKGNDKYLHTAQQIWTW